MTSLLSIVVSDDERRKEMSRRSSSGWDLSPMRWRDRLRHARPRSSSTTNCSSDRPWTSCGAYARHPRSARRFRLLIFRFFAQHRVPEIDPGRLSQGAWRPRGVQIDPQISRTPPELILRPSWLDALQETRSVYGIRRASRRESRHAGVAELLFYRLINRFSEDGLPP